MSVSGSGCKHGCCHSFREHRPDWQCCAHCPLRLARRQDSGSLALLYANTVNTGRQERARGALHESLRRDPRWTYAVEAHR